MIRKVRVVRSEMRLQYEARCRWCEKLVFCRTDEAICRLGLPGYMAVAALVPRRLLHDCRRIAPGRQLLHKGRKP